MFFIGCNECPKVAQAACNDKIDAMIISLNHERDYHPYRWNQTKAAVLAFAVAWQATEVTHVAEPQGMVC
jgi:hypothetical protein